ncbi:MAG: hypothetical protein V4622_07285, partial [Bacteroidota bacterium]
MEEILGEVYVPIDFYEFFIWVLYASLFAVLFYTYKAFNESNHAKFIMPGYFFKILGGLSFTLVYAFYYKGGDCNYYFYEASQLIKIFYEKPLVYIELLFSSSEEAIEILKKYNYKIHNVQNSESWVFTKILSPLNILAFNSYLGLTFLTSLISFVGSYFLFKVMRNIIKNNERTLFYFCFLIPSVTFWGGGIMKDTITLAAFEILIYLFYNILYVKNKIVLSLI